MNSDHKHRLDHRKMEVLHMVDQNGESWLRVSQGVKLANLPAKSLVGQNSAQTARLVTEAGGPLALATAAANDLKRGVENAYGAPPTPATVINGNGWYEETDLFVSAQCDLGAAHNGKPLIDARRRNAAYSSSGTLRGWQQSLRLVRGNPILEFALATSFVGPILPFFPGVGENVGFELEGPTSIGKTTVLRLAASVWGAPSDVLGSWDTTAAGLETSMQASDGTILLLDEASKAKRSSTTLTQELLLKLSDGRVRARYDSPAGRPSRFAFLSTSNLSLDKTPVATRAEHDAIKARMPCVPAHRSDLGVLDRLQAGVESAAGQLAELARQLDQNFGLAGPLFAQRIAFRANRRNGRRRLEELAAHLTATFKAQVPPPASPAEQRVLDKFAMVFAAGHLAHRRGIIPAVTRSVRMIYLSHLAHRATAPLSRTPYEIVRRYADEHADSLVRIGATYREYTPAELDSVPGFLKQIGGVQHLLLRRSKTKALFGPRERLCLEELRAAGKLHATEGLQHQTRVRRKPDHDRFYAFELAELAFAPELTPGIELARD